jgi:hypothetical protein
MDRKFIGYHNELKVALLDFIGKELKTHEIKKIFHRAFPDINLDSILAISQQPILTPIMHPVSMIKMVIIMDG